MKNHEHDFLIQYSGVLRARARCARQKQAFFEVECFGMHRILSLGSVWEAGRVPKMPGALVRGLGVVGCVTSCEFGCASANGRVFSRLDVFLVARERMFRYAGKSLAQVVAQNQQKTWREVDARNVESRSIRTTTEARRARSN